MQKCYNLGHILLSVYKKNIILCLLLVLITFANSFDIDRVGFSQFSPCFSRENFQKNILVKTTGQMVLG